MFRSLRTRSLFVACMAIFLMFSIAIYGRQLFENATGYGDEISGEFKDLSRVVSALKSPILEMEVSLYLYMLKLNEGQKTATQQYMNEVFSQLADLSKNKLVTQDIELNSDVKVLQASSINIKSSINTIFAMLHKDRYPALTILSDYLGPNNEEFLAAFQIADFEAEELINETAQFHVKNILNNLKYAWGQMISSTRILISARTGVFGKPDIAMRIVSGNLATYSRQVDELISELEKINQQGQLGMQQSAVLADFRRLQQFRALTEKTLIAILNSDDWRLDITLIEQRIKPEFTQAQGALTRIERRLQALTSYNLSKTTEATETLSNFLWLFSGFVVLLFMLMYMAFEFWLRRPIVKIGSAIDTLGKGKGRAMLKHTGLQEVDELVMAFCAMQQQITSRQQRLTAILENAGEGIITIDDTGLIESFNTAAELIFGYQEKEVLGKNIKLLMPPEYADHHDGYLKRYRESGGSSTLIGKARDLEGLRKDTTVFPMDLTISVIYVQNERKFIGVIQDTTENKNYNLKLQEEKEKAELAHIEITRKNQEIQLSINQLRETQSQLVEAEKMASLGALVAGVAHEINTPIGIGVTASSHLMEELKTMKVLLDNGELTQSSLLEYYQEAMDASEILMNNLNRAADLVRSFKQVAVDQSSEEKRSFNMAEYVREILLNLRPHLKQTGHTIEIECDQELTIKSMPGAIAQILTNLIMNSLLHAFTENEQGKIVINFRLKDTEKLMLNYSDNGIGMTADIVQRIYDPFFTTRRKDGGSGLGLHIVYNLVTQTLNGRVRCDSKPGTGTSFAIEISLD